MEAQLTVAKQVLERAEELHGADDPKLTAPLKQLGSIYNALGDYKSATEVCVCVSLSLPFLFGTPPRFYVCFGLDYPFYLQREVLPPAILPATLLRVVTGTIRCAQCADA